MAVAETPRTFSEYRVFGIASQGKIRRVAAFEKASGIEITRGWNEPETVGQAVRQVLNGTAGNIQQQLERLHDQALRIVTSIENELKKDL